MTARVNRYDTATRKGQEPREGVRPRVREAVAGSSMDEVFASRYLLLEDDVVVVEFDGGDGDPGPQDDPGVDAVIEDETPPDAKPRKK